MNYATIKSCDIANGPGVRVSLFVSGCTHHCEGCFNEVAWNFDYGEKFTKYTMMYICNLLDKPWISGLSILGGEPLESENVLTVSEIVSIVKNKFPNKTIWVYTGNTYENICNTAIKYTLLKNIDVLVDGPFIESLKDISLQFRGSCNQRIIDVPKSLRKNEVVLYQEE